MRIYPSSASKEMNKSNIKGVRNQGGFVRSSNLYLMADPEENGGSRRNIILKKNKKKFSQRHESSNQNTI